MVEQLNIEHVQVESLMSRKPNALIYLFVFMLIFVSIIKIVTLFLLYDTVNKYGIISDTEGVRISKKSQSREITVGQASRELELLAVTENQLTKEWRFYGKILFIPAIASLFFSIYAGILMLRDFRERTVKAAKEALTFDFLVYLFVSAFPIYLVSSFQSATSYMISPKLEPSVNDMAIFLFLISTVHFIVWRLIYLRKSRTLSDIYNGE